MSLKCTLHVFKIKNGTEYAVEPFEIDLNSRGSTLNIFTECVEMDNWQSLMAICFNSNRAVEYQCSLYERGRPGVEARLKELINYMQHHPHCGAWHIYLQEANVGLRVLLTKLKQTQSTV
jgi:hypothetical protein